MLFRTILADLAAHIDRTKRSGWKFWLRAFVKLMVTPAMQVVVVYRFSSALYQHPLTRPLAFILRMFTIVWGGTEIHPDAKIGPGFCVVHSHKVVIGEGVVIGSNVRVSHGVSIGGDVGRAGVTGCPRIGDNVMLGVDSYVMGNVTVGDWAMIGAKALVIKDVPAYGVAAGIPAKVLRIADPAEYEALLSGTAVSETGTT